MTELTFPAALDAVRREEDVRASLAETEIARNRHSLFGVDVDRYVRANEETLNRRAGERLRAHASKIATLKRALIDRAAAGDVDAYMALAAIDRGDAGAEDRAEAVLAGRTS